MNWIKGLILTFNIPRLGLHTNKIDAIGSSCPNSLNHYISSRTHINSEWLLYKILMESIYTIIFFTWPIFVLPNTPLIILLILVLKT